MVVRRVWLRRISNTSFTIFYVMILIYLNVKSITALFRTHHRAQNSIRTTRYNLGSLKHYYYDLLKNAKVQCRNQQTTPYWRNSSSKYREYKIIPYARSMFNLVYKNEFYTDNSSMHLNTKAPLLLIFYKNWYNDPWRFTLFARSGSNSGNLN